MNTSVCRRAPVASAAALVVVQVCGACRVVAPRKMQLLDDPSGAKATNPAASSGFVDISNEVGTSYK